MNTKIMAACFAALFLANTSYAQDKRVEWGLRFGIGGTELYDMEALTDNFEVDRGFLGEDEWDDDHLTSLSGGISLAVGVAGHWGVETGAYYQRKGAKLRRHYDLRTAPTPTATDYMSHSTTEIKLHYVRVPAMARYSRQIFSRPVRWEVKLGPYFAYAFKGEAEVRYNERPQAATAATTPAPRTLLNPNAPRGSYDLFEDAAMTQALRSLDTRASASGDVTYESRRLDVGGTVGGGITLWRKLYVGAQYDIGITSVMRIGGIWQNNGADEQKLRNNTMTFQVGYNF